MIIRSLVDGARPGRCGNPPRTCEPTRWQETLARIVTGAALVLAIGACTPAADDSAENEGATAVVREPADSDDGAGAGATSSAEADESQLSTAEPTATEPAATTEQAPSTPDVGPDFEGELATYTNTVYGYSVDYPAAWHIETANPDVIMLMSFEPTGPGSGGIPADEAKIDIVASPEGTPRSLDEVANVLREQANEVLRYETWQLADGTKALRMDTEGGMGSAAVLYAIVNGQSVMLSGFGDLEAFDIVARSLRPSITDMAP